MTRVGLYNSIGVLLAITAVFSTVAVAFAQGQSEPFVTNVVYSSQQTGGVSVNGQDGEDGKDGQDGKPGVSGRSVINVDGQSSASVYLRSVGGDVQVKEAQIAAPSSSSSAFVYTFTSSNAQPEGSADSSSTASQQDSPLTLKEALFSLQLMLVKYVSVLF